MDAGEQKRVCEQFELSQKTIRARLLSVGLAGNWHVAKASEILQDPALFVRYVAPADEVGTASYCQQLPELMRQAVERDKQCADLWSSGEMTASRAEYDELRQQLAAALLRFRFRHFFYEHLARRDLKLAVQQATEMAGNGLFTASESNALQSRLRFTLQKFLELGAAIAKDLQALDEARAQLIAGHQHFARWMAHRYVEHGDFPKAGEVSRHVACGIWPAPPEGASYSDALFYAMSGLRKAATNFDSSDSFRFATYAQWWIRQAILKKTDWEC